MNEQTAIVVGSGITGLMTAHQAARAGYCVRVLSKSPDPRCCSAALPGTAESVQQFESSTWDGSSNRYVTLTEGHPYLDLDGYINVMYPGIAKDFQTCVTEGGMLVLPHDHWDTRTQQFLAERDRANEDKTAILELFHEYVDENRASMQQWYEFLIQTIQQKPQLLKELSLHTQGVDRFYDEASLFVGALSAQSKQNIVKASYKVNDLLQHTDFKPYWQGLFQEKPFIQGGGLTIYGLAFNIHTLCRWLLDELEDQGVALCLGSEFEVVEIDRAADGAVSRLITRAQERYSAKHIFLHPGAYSHSKLFGGTSAQGLAGVKGLWMRIKDAQAWFGQAPRPNKIHGGKYQVQMGERLYKGQVADLNIMPQFHERGWDLIIGSGYLFVGCYPFLGDLTGEPLADPAAEADRQAQIRLAEELVFRAFAQVVSRIYGLDIDVDAVLQGTHPSIDIPSKGCVRSWTPDDRELRSILPTTGGGVLLVDGGGNTGSTTKSLFVSATAIAFTQAIDAEGLLPLPQLQGRYESIRAGRRLTKEQMPIERWAALEDKLNQVVKEHSS